MRRGKMERYAGPCSVCLSCVDYEDGICTLLYIQVKNYSNKHKCIAYQPRRVKNERSDSL